MTASRSVSLKSILGIFCHPDDEVLVSGLLNRARSHGYNVHLICATRGEGGRIRHPELVTESTQAQARSQEYDEVCARLKVSSHRMLDFPDGKAETWDRDSLTRTLIEHMNRVDPQIVVTLDYQSEKGHPDHNEAHRRTTEAFWMLANRGTRKLYYLGWYPRNLSQKKLRFLPLPPHRKRQLLEMASEDDRERRMVLALSRTEFAKKLELMRSYRSQFPDERGRYYRMPWFLFKRFARYECYRESVERDGAADTGYDVVEML